MMLFTSLGCQFAAVKFKMLQQQQCVICCSICIGAFFTRLQIGKIQTIQHLQKVSIFHEALCPRRVVIQASNYIIKIFVYIHISIHCVVDKILSRLSQFTFEDMTSKTCVFTKHRLWTKAFNCVARLLYHERKSISRSIEHFIFLAPWRVLVPIQVSSATLRRAKHTPRKNLINESQTSI